MSEAVMDIIKNISQSEIEAVVQQDQRNPSLKILKWQIASLSNSGFDSPEGLFSVTGLGEDAKGVQPWSVVLKLMEMPAEDQDPSELHFWKRDFLVYQSGLLQRLPNHIVPPRCYGVNQTEQVVWIWMEHIHEDIPHPWSMDQFAFAARQLGRFNGSFLTTYPMPEENWLPKWTLSSWNANVDFANAWENPYVRKYLPERNRHRVQSIWDERERFSQALEKLPKVFSHGDAQPRNLFIRKNVNGEPELTAIDWALCGGYPIGAELVPLIAFAIQFREIKVEAMKDLSEAVLSAYILGLWDVGWKGDPDLVRLGYQAYLLMSWGIGLPGNLAWGMRDELLPYIERFYGGISIDEMLTSAAYQFDHILDYADQARKTMARFEE